MKHFLCHKLKIDIHTTQGGLLTLHICDFISLSYWLFFRKILLTSFCVRNACKLHKPMHQNTVFKQKYNDVWYSRKNTNVFKPKLFKFGIHFMTIFSHMKQGVINLAQWYLICNLSRSLCPVTYPITNFSTSRVINRHNISCKLNH